MTTPLVKICGITRLEDAERAAGLGAFAVGFVFWPASPRVITAGRAAAIARALPKGLLRAGVFVNQPPAEVAAIVREVGLDVVQLHGDERVGDYASIGARIFKAVQLESEPDLANAIALDAIATPLIDAADRSRRGGTGRTADWAYAARLARSRAAILAGGLTSDNVGAAIAAVRPWALDVSSGVEDAPGVKSAERLAQFFAAVTKAIARTEHLAPSTND